MDWDRLKQKLAGEAQRGVELDIDRTMAALGEYTMYVQAMNGKAAADAASRLLVLMYDAGYQYGYQEGVADGRSQEEG